MKLPNFLVIGTQKGGTTTLHRIMMRHSKIYLPECKEVQYFSLNYEKGIKWYANHFNESKWWQIKGEITPYYLFHPKAAKRIKETIPRVKLIVLLRNPIDRTISQYYHAKRHGFEALELEKAIKAEKFRLSRNNIYNHQKHSYIARSKYAEQLSIYESLFPAKNIKLIKSENLFDMPRETWKDIQEFLGIKKELLDKEIPKSNTGNGEYQSVSRETKEMIRMELAKTIVQMKTKYGIEWK